MSDSSTSSSKKCSVKGCNKKYYAKNLCNAHYLRNLRGLNKDLTTPIRDGSRGCRVDGCERRHMAKGFCKSHYERMRKTGTAGAAEIRNKLQSLEEVCSVKNCSLKVRAKNLCNAHYIRKHKKGSVGSDQVTIKNRQGCLIVGCDKEHHARGLCNTHASTSNKFKLPAEKLVEYLSSSCMVCGSTYRLSIDHDHSCCPTRRSCGKCVRGVLCSNCNVGLGQLKDDIAVVENLLSYLKMYRDENKQ